MQKVVCDKCQKQFKISIKKQKIEDDIERVYFVCPKCKEEYTSYYSNDEIKDKQNQIRAMQEEYLKLRGKSFKKAFKLQKEINKSKEEIGVDMDHLRRKVEN